MLASFVDEKFPKWAKILLAIFGGYAVVYRAFLFIDDCMAKKDEKNTKALIVAIVCFVLAPLGFILGIVDIFTGILSEGKAKVLR